MSTKRVALPAVLIALWTVAGLVAVVHKTMYYVSSGTNLPRGRSRSGRLQNAGHKVSSSTTSLSAAWHPPVAEETIEQTVPPVGSRGSYGPAFGCLAVASVMVSAAFGTPGAAVAESVPGANFDMKIPGFSKDTSYGENVKAYSRADGAMIAVGPIDSRMYRGSGGFVNWTANQRMGPGGAVKQVLQNQKNNVGDVLEYEAGQPPPVTVPLTFPSVNDSSPLQGVMKALPDNHVWLKTVKKEGKEVAAMIISVPVTPKLAEDKASIDAIVNSFAVNM